MRVKVEKSKYLEYLKFKYSLRKLVLPFRVFSSIHIVKKLISKGSFPHTYEYEKINNTINQISPGQKSYTINTDTEVLKINGIGLAYLENGSLKFFEYIEE